MTRMFGYNAQANRSLSDAYCDGVEDPGPVGSLAEMTGDAESDRLTE